MNNIFDVKYINTKNNLDLFLQNNIFIHKKLYLKNIEYKNMLNDIPYDNWKIIRSISHDYEIIGNNRIHNISILNDYNIISRAYYKLYEILNTFESTLKIKEKQNMYISCLCEAPGGFIQCLRNYRKNPNDMYISISKIDDEKNKIDWKVDTKNLKIVYGDGDKNNDGNLYNPIIINAYIKSHNEKVDLVTADGGLLLDGIKENYKSNFHMNLYLSQLYIACKVLKNNGIFILKIYEISQKVMIDFLMLVNRLFINVKIIKPHTSRQMNNEKYLVCYNRKLNCQNIEKNIFKIIKKLWNNKDLLLTNLVSTDYFNQNKFLLTVFKKTELNNLIKQNEKLKQSVTLRYTNKDELKNILKNRKRKHLKCAYNWLYYNNIN